MSEVPHLCHVFATFVPGGPQVRTCRIVNTIGARYRHTFMAIDGRTDAADLLDPALDFAIVPAERGRGGIGYPIWLASRLRRLEPSLLLTYNWGSMDAVIAANLRRIAPLIHTEDGFGPDEAIRQKRRRVLARRLLLRRARAVVAPSLQLVTLMRRVWRLPEARIRHIPNGIDCRRFSPGTASKLRRELGVAPDAHLVGTVAHLRREKRLERLLEAVASLNDPLVHLLLVGDGPERVLLERRGGELGLQGRLHLIGQRDDPLDCYRAMDLFALSSETEQMPIALLEAMAAALPVVSTDVGDVRKMVATENRAHIVEAGDRPAFSRALADLVSHADKRREIGRCNREHCLRHYRDEQMIESWRRVYEAALS